MIWGLVIGLLVWVVIWLYIANLMTEAAAKKGYPDINAFKKVFFLGIFGCLYIIALPDLVAQKNQEEIIRLLKDDTEKGIKKPSMTEVDELPDL